MVSSEHSDFSLFAFQLIFFCIFFKLSVELLLNLKDKRIVFCLFFPPKDKYRKNVNINVNWLSFVSVISPNILFHMSCILIVFKHIKTKTLFI